MTETENYLLSRIGEMEFARANDYVLIKTLGTLKEEAERALDCNGDLLDKSEAKNAAQGREITRLASMVLSVGREDGWTVDSFRHECQRIVAEAEKQDAARLYENMSGALGTDDLKKEQLQSDREKVRQTQGQGAVSQRPETECHFGLLGRTDPGGILGLRASSSDDYVSKILPGNAARERSGR